MNVCIPKGFVCLKTSNGEDVAVNINTIEGIVPVSEHSCKIYTVAGVDSSYNVHHSFSELLDIISKAQ